MKTYPSLVGSCDGSLILSFWFNVILTAETFPGKTPPLALNEITTALER